MNRSSSTRARTAENVFFASADQLLPEDPGGNAVVWDARVGGGFPVVTVASVVR